MVTREEQRFVEELEIFRKEAESAIQFFYSSLAMNGYPFRHSDVLAAMNETPLFWMTVRGSLQSSTWITLGRVFDQDSPHNVDRLLGLAQRHRLIIFSHEALRGRKLKDANVHGEPPEWLHDYVRDAYIPTANDFRRLRKYVLKYRRIYESKYRDIRNHLHAHKVVAGQTEIDNLYKDATVREVEGILAFLKKLHEALWQTLHNATKPVLRPIPYSATRMIRKNDEGGSRGYWHVQQKIVAETKNALRFVKIGVTTDKPKSTRRRGRAKKSRRPHL